MGVYAPGLQPFISVKFSQVAITVSIALLALCKPVMADMISCADVRYLMGESTNQFSKTRSEVESEFGGLKSTLELPGAQYCVIVEGIIKDTYRCTWKYPYRDEQAGVEFEKLVAEFAGCLGNEVTVAKDQAVNHPDTYDSYLFALAGTEARVTLKDKRELNSTFVFFAIEESL